MVSALDFGSSGSDLSPGRGHCAVFLGKTLYSHSASLHSCVSVGTSIASREDERRNTPVH